MSSSNSSEVPNQTPEKKRRYLSAEKKFQIYLEAQEGGKPVGELLRREGLFSTDLARIRQQVSPEAYEAIKRELQDKERALADQSVELAILRKKTNGGSWDR
jgi:transposase-like protein